MLVAPDADWPVLLHQARLVAPEAFDGERPLNLIRGSWSERGAVRPAGPVDTIVLVDSVDELIAEMNVSNGSLVATVACDDTDLASDLGAQVRGFKLGINAMRSRGDRDEAFGGVGQSWRGCFVGGRYSVDAVTNGPAGERLAGNFEDYTLMPEAR